MSSANTRQFRSARRSGEADSMICLAGAFNPGVVSTALKTSEPASAAAELTRLAALPWVCRKYG
jgi:hypothetical protein